MSQESDKTELEARSIAEVDRIRNILFGPQMRLYEQQFKRIASQLDLVGRQLEELKAGVDQQRTEQESQTRKLQEDMHQHNSRLEQIEAGFERREAELTAQMRQLAVELRKQSQELRGELTTALHALEDGKTDRHDLGDLLVEMGTRLKGQMGLADLLGQLEEVAKSQPAE